VEPGGANRKLGHLDGLRGLAAVIVVLNHFVAAFLPAAVYGSLAITHFSFEKTIYTTPLQLFVAGNFSVCIFFALSGFVLSQRFFTTKDLSHVRVGAAKRYFRLMPPVLASVVISYVIYKFGLTHNQAATKITGSTLWLGQLWPHPVGLLEALWHGTYGVIIGNADTTLFNNPLWTMKLEFYGSMLIFAFLALFGTASKRWVVYVVLILLLRNGYYLAFIAGVALCDLAINRPQIKFGRLTLIMSLATGLLLGAAPTAPIQIPGLPLSVATIPPHVLGAILVLFAAIYSKTMQRALSTNGLRYLGKISFSVYLLHVLILGSFTAFVFTYFIHHYSYFHALLAAGAISVPVIWMSSHYFMIYVDAPSVILANIIGRRWFGSKPIK
jgi:peptidoglycan/LPS O-acetylase OafA/YrhL